MASPLIKLSSKTNQITLASNTTKKPPIKPLSSATPSSKNLSKLDLTKLPSLKRTTPLPAKMATFTESILEKARQTDKYREFIAEHFKETKIIERKIKLVRYQTSDPRSKYRSDSNNFSKQKSKGITDIKHLETIIKQLDEFNDITNPSRDARDEAIKKHAQARILLFYQLCVGHYQNGSLKVQTHGASLQIGKGKQAGEEACHHALFPEISNSFFGNILQTVSDNVKNYIENTTDISETLLLLFSIGIPKEEIDSFIESAKKDSTNIFKLLQNLFTHHKLLAENFSENSSMLNEKNLLYFMHNHTLITSSHVNRVDEMIEQYATSHKTLITREEAARILENVAQGGITPLKGALALNKLVEKALSDSARALLEMEQRVQEIETLAKKILTTLATTQHRPEVKITEIKADFEKLKEQLNLQEAKVKQSFPKRLLFQEYKKTISAIVDFSIFKTPQDQEDFATYCLEQNKGSEILDKTLKHITGTLKEPLTLLQESTTGKYLNPKSILEQKRILKIQLQGTQEVLKSLATELEPVDYTILQLEVIKQNVLTQKL